MTTKFRKTLRFQIGAIVSLVLAILLTAFISMQMVSARYDRQVLTGKQEKLRLIGHGLSKGMASVIQEGRSPRDIRFYFESQAHGIVDNNPGIMVGLYLPGIDEGRFFGARPRENRFLLMKRQADLTEDEKFFDVRVSKINKAMEFMEESRGGIVLGRADPIVSSGQVRGAVLVAEYVQAGLPVFRLVTRIMFFLVPPCLIAGTVATAWLLARLKRGVKEITTGLAAMEKDVKLRLSPPASGELAEIAAAINKMADAAEQKMLLEEQLEKSSRLAALGRLVAGVAHEIRNPLGVMKATVQVMQDEFRGQDKLAEYLLVLREQVDRQNRIIQELLDYARPVPPIFQPVQVNDILETVLGFARPYFQQHRVDVAMRTAGELPPVNADVEKLKQAFLNIIFNAVEAMPDGGRLTVRTAPEGGAVVVEFADTGRGIREEDLDKLFDPFFTTKNTGTGLGLAMVHKIIEIHGGKIDVHSKFEQGTTFRITLPVSGQEG